MLGWLLAAGVGFGASIAAAGTFVTESVEESETGVATAFLSVMRLIGGGIGSELAAGILARSAVGGEPPTEGGFVATFWIAAAGALAGAGIALFVPENEHTGN